MSANFIRALTILTQTAIVARYVSPEVFGSYALGMAIIGLAMILAEAGICSYIIQKKSLDVSERSSLFVLGLLFASIVAAAVFLLAEVLAFIFEDQNLRQFLTIAAPCVVLSTGLAHMRAKADRDNSFGVISIVEVFSVLVSASATVYLAADGWGIVALALGYAVGVFVAVVAAFILVEKCKLPIRRFRLEPLYDAFHFSAPLLANNLINHLNQSMDLLIGAKVLGAEMLGAYTLPRTLVFQLQGMTNAPVNRVLLPMVSAARGRRADVGAVYGDTLSLLVAINAPIFIFISFNADYVVVLLYGDSWASSVAPLMFLGLWGYMRSAISPVGALLIGSGRPKWSLVWNCILLLLIPLVVWAGSRWGGEGIAVCLVAAWVFMLFPLWRHIVFSLTNVTWWRFFSAIMRPALLALLVNCLVDLFMPDSYSLINMLVRGGTVLVIFFIATAVVDKKTILSLLHLLGIRFGVA